MRKLLTRLAWAIALVVVAHYGLKSFMSDRTMEHFNTCHEQLHIAQRLHAAADNRELDQVLADYRECVVNKSTFLDRLFFGKKDIDAAMDGIKLMNRK